MATVLPYLPAALEALMAREADVTDMTDVLTLLVQLITRFKEALGKLVEVVLPIAVARVHGLLGEGLACPDAACGKRQQFSRKACTYMFYPCMQGCACSWYAVCFVLLVGIVLAL
jgi:hypothetical protein